MVPTRRLREEEVEARKQKIGLDKDETEQRLEKILFGDQAGFLDSLQSGAQTRENNLHLARSQEEDTSIDEDAEDIQRVADENLFFLDAGTGQLPPTIARDLQDDETGRESGDEERRPLWVDSDDERIVVSLASNTRLRKLRDTEDDDVVTGTEYIRRLRRQYERLHPVPAWVTYARKKRKLVHNQSQESDDDSDISMDDQSTLSSVQPLAELLRTGGALTRADSMVTDGKQRRRKLRPEVIDIQRVKDISGSGPSSIDQLEFHPYYPLLLSAGPSSTINLYHVSPDPPNPNPIVTSLHVKGNPLHTAAFCLPSAENDHTDANKKSDGTRVILSSRRRYFHTWSLGTGQVSKINSSLTTSNLSAQRKNHEQRTTERLLPSPCGRYVGLIGSSKAHSSGVINVLSTFTFQWLCTCRIDQSDQGVADFTWWRDGNGFAVAGKNGEISEYDIESRRIVLRWRDEGAVGTTVIALGGEGGRKELGSDKWVAVGSSSGVVNVYDRRELAAAYAKSETNTAETVSLRPKPLRSFDQLTTPISFLQFSYDGQMLVMGSRWKKNALRLIHLPSCTVYRNWPTDKTPLGRISSVALSRDGGYLATGNEQGKIRLWQIRD